MRPALNEMNTASLAVYLKLFGAIAQLGERLHGMQEVGGSIPPGSTKISTHGFTMGQVKAKSP